MTTPKKLTAEQLERLPAMLSGYLLVNPQHEVAQQNLQLLVNCLDDEARMNIYKLVKTDLTARAQRQITALKNEMEKM